MCGLEWNIRDPAFEDKPRACIEGEFIERGDKMV
jgi:hypothetical protein